MPAHTTPRPDPEAAGTDERAILLGWLAFHRSALAMKCDGLSGDQLTAMAVPSSNLSLLGLVRHMTEMENAYFRYGLGGGRVQMIYATPDDPEADIERVTPRDSAANLARWRAECDHADNLISTIASMDAPGPDGRPAALRRRLVKVLQEYARHNGHADLIRERIDGMVGE